MSRQSTTRLVYLTAGAGGMYCGSCLHDNALAKAIGRLGWDVQLVPLYTPIRTDEQDVSVDQVFLGGLNVYLQQWLPWFRYLPRMLDRFLDRPWLIRRVTSRAIEIDASRLGALALSVLRGSDGNQRKEVHRLVDWLQRTARPDVIVISNLLVSGFAREWKRRSRVPVLVTLQGDDVFLEGLPESFRRPCLDQIRKLDSQIDGYLVHSRSYADRMQDYLGLPGDKMRITPLGIDTQDFEARARTRSEEDAFRIGYLARLAPEKGLHHLVDAFLELQSMPVAATPHLEIAGWLGPEHRTYAERQFERLRSAGLETRFRYHGVLDRQQKLDFLSRQIDVFSVPTEQAEPKGLFLLEAMAAGVAVVQPAIGSFPEILAASREVGWLVPPRDPKALASAWQRLSADSATRVRLGSRAREFVLRERNGAAMAQATIDVLREFLSPTTRPE